jgi:hypothetical protein
MQNEPIEVTLKVTGILEKLGVPYVIGGSLASTLYGMESEAHTGDTFKIEKSAVKGIQYHPDHMKGFAGNTELR